MKPKRNVFEAMNAVIRGLNEELPRILTREANKEADRIMTCATGALVSYYEDYAPTSYVRNNESNDLRQCFVRVCEVHRAGSRFIMRSGVRYEPRYLDTLYYKYGHSESYSSYNPPDSEWILTNFLEGIHTKTGGEQNSEDAKKSFEIMQSAYSRRPWVKIKNFIKNESYSIESRVNAEIVKSVVGKMFL